MQAPASARAPYNARRERAAVTKRKSGEGITMDASQNSSRVREPHLSDRGPRQVWQLRARAPADSHLRWRGNGDSASCEIATQHRRFIEIPELGSAPRNTSRNTTWG
eukprot:2445413-Pleurochrysis_carterae.AAC.1